MAYAAKPSKHSDDSQLADIDRGASVTDRHYTDIMADIVSVRPHIGEL
jgi:hypothetical protein